MFLKRIRKNQVIIILLALVTFIVACITGGMMVFYYQAIKGVMPIAVFWVILVLVIIGELSILLLLYWYGVEWKSIDIYTAP